MNRFRELGFKFDVCERGCKSGREQGIDDKIQKELFRLACSRQPRGTVVLATGDGNGHELDEGFIPALQAVHEAGFAVEVMSWAAHSIATYEAGQRIMERRLFWMLSIQKSHSLKAVAGFDHWATYSRSSQSSAFPELTLPLRKNDN